MSEKSMFFFFFQAEDGIRDFHVTGVQTCALPISQIRPEIYVVLLTCTVASLRVFGWIFALTNGGPGTATQVPSYYSFQSFFTNLQVGYGSAIATVMTVIIICVSV